MIKKAVLRAKIFNHLGQTRLLKFFVILGRQGVWLAKRAKVKRGQRAKVKCGQKEPRSIQAKAQQLRVPYSVIRIPSFTAP